MGDSKQVREGMAKTSQSGQACPTANTMQSVTRMKLPPCYCYGQESATSHRNAMRFPRLVPHLEPMCDRRWLAQAVAQAVARSRYSDCARPAPALSALAFSFMLVECFSAKTDFSGGCVLPVRKCEHGWTD